jgi:hypothetical protein
MAWCTRLIVVSWHARLAVPDDEVAQPFHSEWSAVGCATFDHAVGVEQHAIPRLEPFRVLGRTVSSVPGIVRPLDMAGVIDAGGAERQSHSPFEPRQFVAVPAVTPHPPNLAFANEPGAAAAIACSIIHDDHDLLFARAQVNLAGLGLVPCAPWTGRVAAACRTSPGMLISAQSNAEAGGGKSQQHLARRCERCDLGCRESLELG